MRSAHSGHGRRGGWQHVHVPEASDAAEWFAGRLPEDWFIGSAQVSADRDEILVVGELASAKGGSKAEAEGQASRFREDTRAQRMQIADEAQERYSRKVSWGVRVGEQQISFTQIAVPVMTRLRQPERRVLDTLVDSGVARSRSDALAWSVKLVGEHAEDWLVKLRAVMNDVETLRAEGPKL